MSSCPPAVIRGGVALPPATAPPLAIAAAVVGGVGPVGMSVLFSGSTGFRNARLHLHR